MGAVHAGWRGTALDLARQDSGPELRRLLRRETGELRVAIGAGIGPLLLRDTQRRPRRHAYRLRPRGGGVYHQRRRQVARGPEGNQRLAAAEAGSRRNRSDICPLYPLAGGSLTGAHRKLGEHRGLQAALIGLSGGGTIHGVDGFLRSAGACCFLTGCPLCRKRRRAGGGYDWNLYSPGRTGETGGGRRNRNIRRLLYGLLQGFPL